VQKEAPVIKYTQIPAGKKISKTKIDEYGKTNWTFHCYSKFDYVVESTISSASRCHVSLRITRVNMKLTLPIEVITYAQAPPSLLQHENGHVQICTRIYEGAEMVATQACRQAVGKVYRGVGTTADAARGDALDQAAESVCALYRLKTVDYANQVSDRYDLLYANGIVVDSAITEAFKIKSPAQ
jgi:hypothetical protein